MIEAGHPLIIGVFPASLFGESKRGERHGREPRAGLRGAEAPFVIVFDGRAGECYTEAVQDFTSYERDE